MRFCMLESYGDCTSSYSIYLDKEYTVGEFISTVLKERSNEWGNIQIFNTDSCCTYSKGKINNNSFAPDILSKDIKKVTGHGGWTLMDYIIYV